MFQLLNGHNDPDRRTLSRVQASYLISMSIVQLFTHTPNPYRGPQSQVTCTESTSLLIHKGCSQRREMGQQNGVRPFCSSGAPENSMPTCPWLSVTDKTTTYICPSWPRKKVFQSVMNNWNWRTLLSRASAPESWFDWPLDVENFNKSLSNGGSRPRKMADLFLHLCASLRSLMRYACL